MNPFFIKMFKNKRYILIITIIISLSILLSVTYSWFSTEKTKENHLSGAGLSASLIEKFIPPDNWQPGETTPKVVNAMNTGDTDVIVRISLEEYLMLFDVDIDTGNLRQFSTPSAGTLMDIENPGEWAVGHYLPGQPDKTVYNKSSQVYHMDNIGNTSSLRLPEISKYITINFNSSLRPGGSWIYENGYFYYTKILSPGITENPLIDSVSLSSSMSNFYKGAPYRLNIYMEALQATKDSLESGQWPEVNESSQIYQILAPLLS